MGTASCLGMDRGGACEGAGGHYSFVIGYNRLIEFHELIRESDVGWRLCHALRCRSPVDYHDLNESPVYFMNTNQTITLAGIKGDGAD